MDVFILPLTSPSASLEQVGGKGANLAELARAGFPVPPAFLITTAAYTAFVETNGLATTILDLAGTIQPDDPVALDTVSAKIRALFEAGSMPDQVAREIRTAYCALPDSSTQTLPVAVRSSATAEDLPGLSFAGQQDTYLNIAGEDAVLDAVKRCWGSLWTARAIGYRARNKIDPKDVALAVVVQTMIPSEVSGILFTANPLTGRRDEIVIDASYGLGEAIVSGQVEPDHYAVNPKTWQITARKLGAKALAILPRAGGGTDQVSEQAADRQALSDEQILELAQLSERVAAHFGSPQDIEWAWANNKLWLVQSRPITSLYPLPVRNDHPEGVRVYFSVNSIQGLTEPFTPLGRDALTTFMGGFLRLLHIPRTVDEVVFDAGGRLFVDVTEVARDPRLRRVLFGILGNADPGALQIMKRLVADGVIPTEKTVSTRRIAITISNIVPIAFRAIRAMIAPEIMRRQAPLRGNRYIARVRRHIKHAHTLRQKLTALRVDAGNTIKYLFLYILSIALPGLFTLPLVTRALHRWLDLNPGAAMKLVRSLPGNVTTEMDLRLWATAQKIRSDKASYEYMSSQPVETQVAAFKREEMPQIAQQAISRFLDRYGMRAVGEIDMGRPRWRENPQSLFQTLASYITIGDPNLAPDAVFRRGAIEAERAAAEYIAETRNLRWGKLKAMLLGAAIKRMRLLIGLREMPKFYLIKILDAYRSTLLESGQEMAKTGVLEQAEDIFFVPLAQLRRFANGAKLDLQRIVKEQRALYERERGRRQMPRVLLSTGEAFYEGLSEAGTNDLVGAGVSPGVVEGRVRVVLDPHGVRLQPGEILVCPATDPGWTPLFLSAGGLVMELGGMITHGSVVAREYGIPAVVGVHNATTRLHTGQRIRVDGSQGRVTILDDK